MAGFHTDPDGLTYAGYARKDQPFLSGVLPSGPVQISSYLGVWNVNFDGIVGRMELHTRNDEGVGSGWAGIVGSVTYNVSGVSYTKDVRLKVATMSPHVIQLRIPRPDGREYFFDGKMESWNRGVMAGPGTDPLWNNVAFYAYRTGDYIPPSPGAIEFRHGFFNVDESGGAATITVSRMVGSSGTVTVRYQAVNRSATEPEDFTGVSDILMFADGETSKSFSVPIINDSLYEGIETLELILSSPTGGATLGGITRAALDIIDDESMPLVSVVAASITEADNASVFVDVPFVLSAPSSRPVTLTFSTGNDSATAGLDYRGLDGSVTFAPGVIRVTHRFEILPDQLDEEDEGFYLGIGTATGATIGTPIVRVMILDNDATPTLSINDLVITEGDDGVQRPVFTVRLSAPSGRTVRFRAVTANGSARDGEDYGGISAPAAVIAPGETTALIQVAMTGRSGRESDESFFVRLSDPVNALLADPEGEGLIKELRILSFRREGSEVVLTFPTGNTGRRYHVWRGTDAAGPTPDWIRRTPPEGIVGTGEVVTFRDYFDEASGGRLPGDPRVSNWPTLVGARALATAMALKPAACWFRQCR